MPDVTYIGIGGLELARPPHKLRTVLGSCVAIVLHDPSAQIIGMAHCILPTGEEAVEPGKFADQAVDNLIVRMLNDGSRKAALRAKLIGGATMFGAPTAGSLGERNSEAARERLARHGIPVLAAALGGTKGRKVLADPVGGALVVQSIGEDSCMI